MVTSNKFHTEEPQILDATIKNLVAMATRCRGFEYPRNDYFELWNSFWFIYYIYPCADIFKIP